MFLKNYQYRFCKKAPKVSRSHRVQCTCHQIKQIAMPFGKSKSNKTSRCDHSNCL